MDLHYIYICAALECNYLIWLFKLFKHWCATAQKMQATVWSISDEFVLVSSFVIFGLFWPISHCDPPSYCYHFTAFKNKVKHFILTVGLCQTPHITKVKRKCFLFVLYWVKLSQHNDGSCDTKAAQGLGHYHCPASYPQGLSNAQNFHSFDRPSKSSCGCCIYLSLQWRPRIDYLI